MNGLRLFFAVWPPREARNRLWRSLAPLRQSVPGVRWVPSERLHVTLRFMGDTSTNDLRRLVAAADAMRRIPPFHAELAGAGAFPRRGSPRVYWVGVRAAALFRLREILDGELAKAGIDHEERTFFPHVTVGRTRGAGAAGDRLRAGVPGDFPPDDPGFAVAAVHLVRSDLLPEGPRYSNVHEVVLGRRGGRDRRWAGHSRDS